MKKLTVSEAAFCALLKPARKAKGYTQEQLAEAVSTTLRWYQLVEQGKGKPSLDLTLKLQKFLELDLGALGDTVVCVTPTPSRRQQNKSSRAAAGAGSAGPALQAEQAVQKGNFP